ncbi:MAG: RluA family pseudouridine synthase [Pseudomonadota bacterium]
MAIEGGSMAGGRTYSVTIDAGSGGRLDRALATALAAASPALSRSRVKALIEAGHVSAGGATITDPSRTVKPGQNFAILIPDPAPATFEAQAIPLDIVYEDRHLIVLDKPAGLVVHPAPGNLDRTLVNALIAHCGPSLSGIGGVERPGIVHRLDKGTSGLMVAVKTDEAHRGLSVQFARHAIERIYAALVWGVPRPRQGEIAGAIGRSRRDRRKMAVVAGGKPALTRYRVIKELAGGAASLLECRLASGRTHQIRVHLAAIGHPLLGDPAYGRGRGRASGLPARAAAALAAFGRPALDAIVLGFSHPASHEYLRFTKSYERDFNELMNILEAV